MKNTIPTQQTARKSHLPNPSYDKMNDRGKLGGAHIAIIMPSRRPERPTRIEILRQVVIDDEPLDEVS
ncbi:hypothetical protein SUGI_1143770 [Cryptomeria japonica]|nr:hypothetical protein SUGI_1143770 [Cryptomeria japonica]